MTEEIKEALEKHAKALRDISGAWSHVGIAWDKAKTATEEFGRVFFELQKTHGSWTYKIEKG